MKKLIYSKEDLDLILSLENEKKDKEIERLNSIINNDFSKICREKMIDKLSANEMILLQDKEIERLNNIIKRFEEDLREVYLTFGEFSEEYTEKKIRELKGDDKE